MKKKSIIEMSLTTTKKFDTFLSRPLQESNHDLKSVPGVGDVAYDKLRGACIETVKQLVGHFLLLGRDVNKMTSWLKDVCDIRGQEASKISEALDKKALRIISL